MRKNYFLFFCFFLIINVSDSFSQAGQWTWIHGSNAPNSAGNYGTQGAPSATNDPPAVYEPAEWTDNGGNFWFYGGLNSSGQSCNDLWSYNPTTNEWTWISGTATPGDPGSYGTQGIASAFNRPPALGYAAASWVDLNGNFWLFGGYNTGNDWYYSDLWEYKIGTNEWTWMNGPDSFDPSGVYGTQGVANAANYPRSRTECASDWTDKSGNLWLFGAGNGAVGYNDLWRYNITTNEWTWMKGNTTSNAPGTYGTQGLEDTANSPGGRWSHSRWTDNAGNFYLFGGANSVQNNFNDLWRYNPVTNNWTWISGKNTVNDVGFYGTKCVTTASNLPWSRFENRASCTDANGNFWMFGGGYSYNPTSVFYAFNDLWKYCVSSNEWTWESGDSTANSAGSWGTIGVASATNKPNGRDGAAGWTDYKGHLYIFGGAGIPFSNHYNDLWEYTIDPGCGSSCAAVVPPVALFQASDTILCTNDCISFTDKSTNATSWLWSFQGGTPSSGTDQNPSNVCYLDSGIYNVKLVVSNLGGSDSIAFSNYINVSASPLTPNIVQSGDTLKCSTDTSYKSYQWYFNDTLIAGATGPVYIATKNGNYNISIKNSSGCAIAVGINVVLGVPLYNGEDMQLILFPNPAGKELKINPRNGNALKIKELNIYNVLGENIYNMVPGTQNAAGDIVIDISFISSGIYFVCLRDEKNIYTMKFVKQ